MMTTPAPLMVSVFPLMVAGPFTTVYATASREFDEATVVKSTVLPGAKVEAAKSLKVMV